MNDWGRDSRHTGRDEVCPVCKKTYKPIHEGGLLFYEGETLLVCDECFNKNNEDDNDSDSV
jgi:hypothetical protein